MKPKLAEVENPDDKYIELGTCDAVRDDSFVRLGRRGDESELMPGFLGTGRWRRLKGGFTMDSGCSFDTVPTGHAPNVAMGRIPASRANRRINAANGTRIKEYEVKQLGFKTRERKKQSWNMLVTDVKKALKSVATTCDGDLGGECHVLFTRHGGTLVNVDAMKGSYSVGRLVWSKVLVNLPTSIALAIHMAWKPGFAWVPLTKPHRVLFGRLQLHRLRFHKPANTYRQPGG